MPQVETEYETTEGILLLVTAEVTEGRPMTSPDMNGPGEPAEDPTIEIISVKVKDFDFAAEELEGAIWTQLEGDW